MTHSIKFSDDALFQEVSGELVILDLATEKYFGLNEVGSRIWVLLKSDKTIEETRKIILAEFEVEPDQLEADIEELLGDLKRNGLISIVDD